MAALDARNPRRRWLMPAVILLVGGSIAIWASARESQRMAAIETRMKAICESLARGGELEGTLNPRNAMMEQHTIAALRRNIGSRDDAELVQIRVVTGDAFSDRAGTDVLAATHTAILHFDDIEVIALRIRCVDGGETIDVLGFVMPGSGG